jgi:hypothetical protein
MQKLIRKENIHKNEKQQKIGIILNILVVLICIEHNSIFFSSLFHISFFFLLWYIFCLDFHPHISINQKKKMIIKKYPIHNFLLNSTFMYDMNLIWLFHEYISKLFAYMEIFILINFIGLNEYWKTKKYSKILLKDVLWKNSLPN